MTEHDPKQPLDPVAEDSDLTAASSASATTTIHRHRVIEKVGIGRRRPWWFWTLALIPAVVAAVGFNRAKVDGTAVLPLETVAVDTTVAAEPAPETTVAAETPRETVAPEATADVQTTAATAAMLDTVVLADGSLTTFAKMIEATGLREQLAGPGPLTAFAPTDAAFAALPAGALDALLLPENKDALGALMRYHVVGKRLEANELNGDVKTTEGASLVFADDGNVIRAESSGGRAVITTPGQPADNGIVYATDQVLLPPGFIFPGQTNDAGDTVAEDLTVYFDTASSELNAEGMAKVERAIEIVRALPQGTKVVLVGHADTRGKPEKNLALSQARVETVRTALSAAVPQLDYESSFKGAEEPAEDLAKSRRVTIEIQR